MARRSEKRSIFYNLIKNEVTLTQAFYNFLRMECFKDMFIALLNEKHKDKLNPHRVKFENFETEMDLVGEKEKVLGRADLVLNYDGKEYLFEVKIEPTTTLTDNQPEGYLEYLEDDYKRLYFILPRNYFHKYDLYERVGKKLNIKNSTMIKEIVEPQIIYWEDIAEEIKRIAANGANPLLQEFYDILWSKWIGYEIVEFTVREIELIFSEGGIEMCNATIPKIISKLFKVVSDIKAEVLSKDDFQSYDNFGYVLNNKHYMVDQNIKIFYGVEFGVWQEKSNCPLVVEIYTEEPKIIKKLEAFAKQKQFDKYKYGEGETEVVWYKCISMSKEECKNIFHEGEILRRFEELLFKEVVEEVRKEFPREEKSA